MWISSIMNNNELNPKNSIKPKLGISPNRKSLKEYKRVNSIIYLK